MFVEARKSGASPWVWAMAGLVFSLVAAILFFVIRRANSRPGASSGFCARVLGGLAIGPKKGAATMPRQ